MKEVALWIAVLALIGLSVFNYSNERERARQVNDIIHEKRSLNKFDSLSRVQQNEYMDSIMRAIEPIQNDIKKIDAINEKIHLQNEKLDKVYSRIIVAPPKF